MIFLLLLLIVYSIEGQIYDRGHEIVDHSNCHHLNRCNGNGDCFTKNLLRQVYCLCYRGYSGTDCNVKQTSKENYHTFSPMHHKQLAEEAEKKIEVERIIWCTREVCSNNGECYYFPGENIKRCRCYPGYLGEFCTDIDSFPKISESSGSLTCHVLSLSMLILT